MCVKLGRLSFLHFRDITGVTFRHDSTCSQDIIKNNREAKFLVYLTISGCFGYGDRVRAVISLFYLEIDTDRAFLIHWKTPKPLEGFLTPKNVNWTFPVPLLETRKHFWTKVHSHWKEDLDNWQMKNSSLLVSFVKKRKLQGLFLQTSGNCKIECIFCGRRNTREQISDATSTRPGNQLLVTRLPAVCKDRLCVDVLLNTVPRLQNALKNTRIKLRENSTFVIGDEQFGRNNTRVFNARLLIFQNISGVQRKSKNST